MDIVALIFIYNKFAAVKCAMKFSIPSVFYFLLITASCCKIFYLSVLMIWKSFVAPKSVLQLMLISSFIIIFIVIDELG
jgi:hypothetical protein